MPHHQHVQIIHEVGRSDRFGRMTPLVVSIVLAWKPICPLPLGPPFQPTLGSPP